MVIMILSERNQSVQFQLYNILERAKLKKQFQDEWLSGVGGRDMEEECLGRAQRIFRAVELLCIIL